MSEEIKNYDENVDTTVSTNTTPDCDSLDAKNEESSETRESFNPQDYSIIRDMMKEMDEWNKMLKDETHSILKNNYGLTNFAIFDIIPYTDEKIDNMTIEEIKDFIEKHRDTSVQNIPEIETLEDGIKLMKEVKTLQMNLYSAEQEASKLKEQSQDILNDYFEYLSSPEVAAARKSRLDKMKELAEAETDEYKKYNMLKMINSMEQADSMEFIFKRFYNTSINESQSVITQFFDERKGSYVINRYKEKMPRFGFDVNIYKYFFNLEENFLNEKYHAFNNLFLFYYMRFIAYADPNNKSDKLFVQSITSALANMIYHKFNSKIEEQTFIHVIEKFEEFFMDKHDYFMENNTTRPDHPVRVQASAKYEADQKARLIGKMNDLGITGYDESMSAKEMYEFFNTKMEEMLDAQKKEKEAKATVTENDDGSITITPEVSNDTEFVTGMSDDGFTDVDVDSNITTSTTGELENA